MPPHAYDRLSVVDNSFLAIEGPNTHQHVATVAIFEGGPVTQPDGSLDIDRIRAHIAARLHLIPRYRLANQGLGVALFSYAGKLCWGFIADWDLVSDLHDFVLAVEASFEELSRAARGERVVGQGA